MRSLQLHNVTLYVEKPRFDPGREFYQALFGRDPVWVEPGHIACLGTAELAICVHEEEAGHPAGTRELFFWGQDLDRIQADLEATGASVRRTATTSGDSELHCVDPTGNQIRVHPRKP